MIERSPPADRTFKFSREFPTWIAQFEGHERGLSPLATDLRPTQSNQQSLLVRVPREAFDVQPALPPIRRSAGGYSRRMKQERTEIGDDFGLAPKRPRSGSISKRTIARSPWLGSD